MASTLLFPLLLLSLLSLSSPLPSRTVLNAAEVLSDAGFISMSLTLQLLSDSLIPPSQSATIFSPSDAAFSQSGQPRLSLLQFHSSPLTFSPSSLQSLPAGTKIPTMFSGHFLVVTTLAASNRSTSLNNVTIDESPIYDDGSLTIFGVDSFFDPKFNVSAPIQSPSPSPSPTPSPYFGCRLPNSSAQHGSHSFDLASGVLRSRGYSVMASFLDLQLLGFQDDTRWTILAPIDEAIKVGIGNLSEHSSLFHRHVLPCKVGWTDFTNLDGSTMLRTFLEGFAINVTSSGDMVMLNEVPLTSPEMYNSDTIVVHGLHEVLALANGVDEQASSENGGSDTNDHEEF